LLTLAFEILSSKNINLNEKIKNNLINKISECSGHKGIAGGQFLDLSFEHKKVSKKKIIDMEIKKTGKLFSFCCTAPLIIKNKNKKEIKSFEKIGSNIGLLFQVADDLIDYRGSSKIAGKKTRKDEKQGKATLISLMGYNNAVKYAEQLSLNLKKGLKQYGSKSKNLNQTIDYILHRNK
jgi:farnesyl diphosphate synthase